MLVAERAIGTHHVAYLRALIQGLPMQEAWQRYLAFSDDAKNSAKLSALAEALWARARLAARELQSRLSTEHPAWADLASLAAIGRGATKGVAQALPSLASFIAQQGLDPDHYSEAELLAEFRAFHGLDLPAEEAAATAPLFADQRRSQLRGLQLVQGWMVRPVQATDGLALWVAPVTLKRLEAVGIHSVSELHAAVQTQGHHWIRRMPGLGRWRGDTLARWVGQGPLGGSAPTGLVPLPATAWSPMARAQQRLLGHTSMPGAPNADAMAVPQNPADPFGWRSGLTAAESADLGLATRWASALQAAMATQRSYARAARLLVRWCHRVRHLPLAALAPRDFVAFECFVRAPPSDWICTAPLGQASPGWRPLRGPLGDEACRQTLGAARAWLASLDSSHLAVSADARSHGIRLEAIRATPPRMEGASSVGGHPLPAGTGRAGKQLSGLSGSVALPSPSAPSGASCCSDAAWAWWMDWLVADLNAGRSQPACAYPCSGLPSRCRASCQPPPGNQAERTRQRWVLSLLRRFDLSFARLAAGVWVAPLDASPASGRRAFVYQNGAESALTAWGLAHRRDALGLAEAALPFSATPLVLRLRSDPGRWVLDEAAASVAGVRFQTGQVAAGTGLSAGGLARLVKRSLASAVQASSHCLDCGQAPDCAGRQFHLQALGTRGLDGSALRRWLRGAEGQAVVRVTSP